MVASASTLRIQETLLEPQAIPPPPTRHALFVVLIALAALVHLGATGSGDLYSQTEGQYAGAAKEMVETNQWLLPTNDGVPRLQKPPLLYWLTILSFKLFGTSAAAARVPIALSVIVTVALVFLIGEKLADYGRGFIAGMIYLSLSGTFLLSRIVMPEPFVSMLITGSIFFAICGYQKKRFRRGWYAGVWLCSALACLSKGILGFVYPAAVFVLLSLFYREARIRFSQLLRWEYGLAFLIIVTPWHIWAERNFPGYFSYLVGQEWVGHLRGTYDATRDFAGLSVFQFGIMHLAWWFPWSIALLPGAVLAWRRVLRPSEIEFGDTLIFCWMAVILVPLLFLGQRQDYYSMNMWGAFALWAAIVWDRMPMRYRLIGIIAILAAGIASLGFAAALSRSGINSNNQWGVMDARWTAWSVLRDMPASNWVSFRMLLAITGGSLIGLSLLAIYFVLRQRERVAAVALAMAMIPTGFCMIEGVSKMAPYFSMGEIGRFLNAQPKGKVIFEGSLTDGSSLIFYLDQKFFLVNQNRLKENPIGKPSIDIFVEEEALLKKWGEQEPVYLVVEQERISHWKQIVTKRFHIYHQVITSGTYVVLSNQL